MARTLQETHERLLELTGNEVDAVLLPGGQSYLLKDAREKLRQSEERFRNMFTSAATGIAVSTPEGRYLYANAAYCRMLGYTEDELRGLNFAAFTHPDDLARNLDLRDALLAGQRESFLMEKRYLRRNGDIVWTRHSVSATHAAGGEIDTLMVVAEDITERKKAEEVLLLRQTELQALFDLMPAMVWFKDTANGVLRVNQRAANATGKPVEEIEGRSMHDLYPQEAAKYYADDLEVIQSRAPKLGIIEKLRGADNRELWVQTDKVPVCDKAGNVIGIVVMVQDITERKQAEAGLRYSEERLRLITDLVPHGIFAKDAAGRHIFANPALAEMAGMSVEEMIGKDDFDLVASREEAEAYRAADRAVMQSGSKMVISEESRTDRSGRTRFLHTIKIPFTVPETGEPAVLGVCMDITERRQAEEKLNLFRTLVDGSPDAIEVIDPETGQFIDVNATGCARLGYSREEMLSLKVADIDIEKDYRPLWPTVVEEIKKAGFAAILGRHRRKDGSTFPVEVNARYININRGYMVAVVRDITERKRNEGRIRRLVDSNVQGVFFWNTNGQIKEANEAFLGLVGYTREDLKAGHLSWATMTPPEWVERDQRALNQCATGGVCESYEKEYIRKDGTRVPVLIGAAMFEDNPDDGVCFVVDLTERKKLEQQFLRAQRMESIGTLASGVAHDLNNILAPIMMSIEILKSMSDSPQAREILATLEVSAKRGADIVRQVLTFARGVEGERVEIQPKHLLKDLEHIIKDTFPKDIRLQFSIPSDTWTILGDPTQVHQVLLNLCVNARDAMPNGGTLTVAIENCALDDHYVAMNTQAKAGRYVKISVTDTGMGIPPAIVNKIFEPFFTTKELNKGTGLGLSTVMAIVKSHEGTINVYSEPGKGTTFKVYLLATDLASDGQNKQATQATTLRGNGEMILVVDDEASILSITGKTLQAFGYRVLTAPNGAEAVALYAQNQNEIAVVLTDMMMPVMDGPATIYALMKIHPAVKIIAASGLTANGSGNKSPGQHIKHFLTKPYTADALLTTLRAILEEK